MRVTVNGNETQAPEGSTVLDILTLAKVEVPEMVSVQVNQEFVDDVDYATTVIREGDQVEFLYFMGGGSWAL